MIQRAAVTLKHSYYHYYFQLISESGISCVFQKQKMLIKQLTKPHILKKKTKTLHVGQWLGQRQVAESTGSLLSAPVLPMFEGPDGLSLSQCLQFTQPDLGCFFLQTGELYIMALPPPLAPVPPASLCSSSLQQIFWGGFSGQKICPQSSDLPCLECFPVNDSKCYCITCCLCEMVASRKSQRKEHIIYCPTSIAVLAAVDLAS